MTLYEEVFANFPETTKFYRFEGYNSSINYSFNQDEYLQNSMRYLHFSATLKHHMYFVGKKLKQLISKEILHELGYNQLNKTTLLDSEIFNTILNRLGNLSTKELSSIEYSTLPVMNTIISNNTIRSKDKYANDRRIERVDAAICGGGYGLGDEYLKVFDLLTFFYSYQKISPEIISNYLYTYRRKEIENNASIKPTAFLMSSQNRVIKLNPTLYNDFTKYELMESLERIIETENFFPESIFAHNPSSQVKTIVSEYNLKRERVLKLADTIYKRNIDNE